MKNRLQESDREAYWKAEGSLAMLTAILKAGCRWMFAGLVVLVFGAGAHACAEYKLFVQVNRSSPFVVQVLDFRGRPLPGATFLLTLENKQLRFTTDAAGKFTVRALPPGDYRIERTDEQSALRYVDLHVNDNGKKNLEPLVLRWFRAHVYTRSMAGSLRFLKFEPVPAAGGPQGAPLIERTVMREGPLAQLRLRLFRQGTNKPVAETTTTESGDFRFQVDKPGLYVMRFRFNDKERSKVVELDHDPTSVAALDLWLMDSGYVLNGSASAIRGCE